MENLKATILLEEHQKLNAKMVEFGGFYMPLEYSGILIEHHAVRNNVGMFDVSHMGEFLLTGKDALKLIDYVFTNKVTGAKNGRAIYGMLCNEQGGVIDDLFVCKMNDEKLFIVVNASNIESDFETIFTHIDKFEVQLENVSGQFGEIALQGPDSLIIMEALTKIDLSSFKFMTIREIDINGINYIVSRSGYTGEDGFEIYGKPSDIVNLWRILLNEYNVTPCGLGARDTLRYEVALPLYGHEISLQINPFEAGMGFGVKLNKDSFIGKDALAYASEHLSRKIVGVELLQRNVPRAGYEVFKDGNKIGVITTGYISPSCNKPLALALVDIAYTTIGEEVQVAIRNKMIPAKICEKQFYQKNYKK